MKKKSLIANAISNMVASALATRLVLAGVSDSPDPLLFLLLIMSTLR